MVLRPRNELICETRRRARERTRQTAETRQDNLKKWNSPIAADARDRSPVPFIPLAKQTE